MTELKRSLSEYWSLLSSLNEEGEGLGRQIVRGSSESVLIRGVQSGLAVALVVLLARLLGSEDYGVYTYVVALIEVFAMPVRSGLSTLTVREISVYKESGDRSLIDGFFRFGLCSILALSVIVVMMTWSTRDIFIQGWTQEKLDTLKWGLILLPFMALSSFRGASLRGLKSIARGLLPEGVIRPGGFLLLCGGAWAIFSNDFFSPSRTMLMHVLAAAVAYLVGSWMLRSVLSDQRKGSVAYEIRRWLSSIGPLTLISGMQLINSRADIIILGVYRPSSEIGIYRVAAQTGLLVVFGLKAVNMAIAPYLSSLWAAREVDRLERLVTLAARVALLVAAPVALALIVFGDQILGLVFGEEFSSGHATVAILSVGKMVSAAVGSVVVLLKMTGRELTVVKGLMVAAALNVFLNVLLIPQWGMEGAAVATVVSLCLWNIGLWRSANNEMAVDTIAFR